MLRRLSVIVVLSLLAAACGGGDEGDADTEVGPEVMAWCLDHPDEVWDLAEEQGLIGPVEAYYALQGGGIDELGEPIDNPENRALSDEMHRRNVEDNANFLQDLHTNYLEHEAGQLACTLAFADSGSADT